jgi:hypothetical protein
MPLKCLSESGEEFSFRYDETSWEELRRRNESEKHLLMSCCSAGVVLKKSKLGTLFFAHARKSECTTESETAEHLLAKDTIARALVGTGWSAKTEQRGKTPEGGEWVADVLCEHPEKNTKVAFEVQWSRQTEEETKARQERYKGSGVRALWLMRQVNFPLSKDIPAFRLVFNESLKCFEVWLLSIQSDYEEDKYRKCEEAWSQRIPLSDFVRGALTGRLRFAPAYGALVPLLFRVSEVECRKCHHEIQVVTDFELSLESVFPGFGNVKVCLRDEQPDTMWMRSLILSRLPHGSLQSYGLGKIDHWYRDDAAEPFLSNECVYCRASFSLPCNLEFIEKSSCVVEEEIKLPVYGAEGVRARELERWWFGERAKRSDILLPSNPRPGEWIYARRRKGSKQKIESFVGKWLVYRRSEKIDGVWEQIREATMNCKLGINAKVSTEFKRNNEGRQDHVICVYTYDFREKEDVGRVLEGLRELGIKERLSYKTDQATLAGVYASTGGRASLYSSDDLEM